MTPQEKLLETARAEIGYLEKATNAQLDDKTANAGSGNWTKYARDLDGMGSIYNGKKNGFSWCDVFVDWCFITTFGEALGMDLLCQAYQGLGAGVVFSANYFKAKGQFHANNPQPGDQIFFYGATTSDWAHTGLVEKVEGGMVYTIEGNTSGASGVVANGGGVTRKSYALNYSKIAGYGRPDWSMVKDEPEPETKPEMDGSGMIYYKTLADAPEYYRPTLEKLVAVGALQGTGDGLNVSEDFCRIMTVLDRLGKLD